MLEFRIILLSENETKKNLQQFAQIPATTCQQCIETVVMIGVNNGNFTDYSATFAANSSSVRWRIRISAYPACWDWNEADIQVAPNDIDWGEVNDDGIRFNLVVDC